VVYVTCPMGKKSERYNLQNVIKFIGSKLSFSNKEGHALLIFLVGFMVLKPLLTIILLYGGGQFY